MPSDECEAGVMHGRLPGSSPALKEFDAVLSLAALFTGFTKPWYVAGGWALDLFLGCVT
jgi:hypothetical protein